VDAVIRLMESGHTEPINIGSDRLVTVDELAQMAIAASGKKLRLVHDLSKPQGVRGRNADLTLVKQVLNWTPRVDLEDGMRITYKWVEKQVRK
jgi:nucleoside-diphosphate-sugar epimerase